MARKIVLFNSSASMRRIISMMLHSGLGDVEVTEVKTVAEIYTTLQKGLFHVLLFCWEKYDEEWWKFFKQLKQNPLEYSVKLIMLISKKERESIEKAKDFGVVDFLEFPCPPETLAETVNRVCSPISLRRSARFNIPGCTAKIKQSDLVCPADVINISKSGLLCDMKYSKEFFWDIPSILTLNMLIGEEKVLAEGIYSKVVRIAVSEWTENDTPKRIRIAFMFQSIPDESLSVLELGYQYSLSQKDTLGEDD